MYININLPGVKNLRMSPMLTFQQKQRLTRLFGLPVLKNLFKTEDSRSRNLDAPRKNAGQEYWQSDLYEGEFDFTIKFLGIPCLTAQYRRTMTDIYLKRSNKEFFDSLEAMVDKALIPSIDSNSHILEPGCNVGRVLQQASEKYNCRITGLDISERAIKLAKTETFKNREKATFCLSDVLDVNFFNKFSENHFSHAICVSHLVHVPSGPKKDKYLEHLKRISSSVVLFEKIPSPYDTEINNKKKRWHFDDYERDFGFKLFKKWNKGTEGKLVGVFYYSKV